MTRRMMAAWLAGLALAAQGGAWAQTTIYESRDKAGPVFSDKPAPGAATVDLPPPNVVSMPPPAAVTPPAPAPAPAYRSLVIVSLPQNGTIHSNTGAFDFSVRATPALRSTDRFRISLDGTVLPGSHRSTNLAVTEVDWGRAARGDSSEHTLQVAIFDGQGKMLIASDAIRFYVQRAAVGGRQR